MLPVAFSLGHSGQLGNGLASRPKSLGDMVCACVACTITGLSAFRKGLPGPLTPRPPWSSSPFSIAGGGNVVQGDQLGAVSPRGADVRQESGNIEFENPVGIELIAIPRLARPKVRVEIEPKRHGIRAA